ncbi:ATP-binding protein [Streptomyces sp. SAS_275]|uniref:ATP-binding protein n=1 Tax=Streptomyces sp. SAS_275 TaxID=3412746 RepID=UPI00403D52A4
MTSSAASSTALSSEQLSQLFLFEELDDGQLAWLAHHGHLERHPAGHTLCHQGEIATSFFVLLSGTFSISQHVHGADIELDRTGQRGSYAGATRAYLAGLTDQSYPNTVHAVTDLELFVLPAHVIAHAVRTWFPMAAHLLDGLAYMTRRTNVMTGERERLLSLGSLAAGLTHELNNPAAAASRAAAELQDQVAGLQEALDAARADGLTTEQMSHLAAAVQALTTTPPTAPTELLDAADAEDELAAWLEAQGVNEPWDLAAVLSAADIAKEALTAAVSDLRGDQTASALRWMTALIDIHHLTSEVQSAVARVESLVAAAGAYAQLDRSARQMVDMRELLDATLTMLQSRVPGSVRIVRNYPEKLPLLLACGAELNQAWTRLVDNALLAMPHGGQLTVSCASDESHIHVAVADTGPGIPDQDRPRIFDPFFTTRPLGEGTGLGLTVVHEVVAVRHRGAITLSSHPGQTVFRVSLPINPPTATQKGDQTRLG